MDNNGKSAFTIPIGIGALMAELQRAQIGYEIAKRESEEAARQEYIAVSKQKTLKRDLIGKLRENGIAITRAEKEYVDCDEWKESIEEIEFRQDAKRARDTDESIARQRMLTLRAAILPTTALMLAKLTSTKSDEMHAVDAGMGIAEDDPAYSADASVAHNV